MTQVTTTAQFRVEGGVTDAAPLFVELAIVLSFCVYTVGGFRRPLFGGFSTDCLTTVLNF